MSETMIQPRFPTPSGTEYFYWYNEDVLIKSDLLSIFKMTIPTEENFPILYKDGYEFVGWYYYTDNAQTNKVYVVYGEEFDATRSWRNNFHVEWKKAYNKVSFYGTVLIDLTSDTIGENNILVGYKGHDKTGAAVNGTITDAREEKF